MLPFQHPSVLKAIEKAEKGKLSPVKVHARHTIHCSVGLGSKPSPGYPKLADFGHAIYGPGPYTHPIQPRQLQAPEVLLGAEWSYSADIWNLGVLVGLHDLMSATKLTPVPADVGHD